MSYYRRRQLFDKLEAERKFGKPIMKDYRTGEWIPAQYVSGVLFKGRPEEKKDKTIKIKKKIDIVGILKSKDIPGTAIRFIEEYEKTHPEEVWNNEAEKIYSTGGETLYQFRGEYYRGTRPFISRKNKSGRECGSYGKETLQLMRDREENNITLTSIKKAIELSRQQEI